MSCRRALAGSVAVRMGGDAHGQTRVEAASAQHGRPRAEAVAASAGSRPRQRRDPFTGELRRREVLPLLVLHYIAEGPSYGNQLMERIAQVTAGVLSVNPNTMYPLLRPLEARGLIEGSWEHPERRTRRFYSLTEEGRKEYRAPARGGAAVPRLGRARDRRDRARGLRLMAARGAAPAPGAARRRRRRSSSGPTCALAGFVEGFGHVSSVARTGPPRARKVVWESGPGGRGRVTEKVVEHAGRPLRHEVYEERAGRQPDLRSRATPEGSRVAAAARVRAHQAAGRCGASPTCSSSAARCATPWPHPAPLRGRGGGRGRRSASRPSDSLRGRHRTLEGRMYVFKAAVVGAGTMGGEIAQVIASAGIPVVLKDVKQKFVDPGLEKAREVTQGQLGGLVKQGEDHPGAGRRAARGDPRPHHRHHRVRGLRRRGLRDRGRAGADGDQAGRVRGARRGHARPRDPRLQHLVALDHARWPRPPAAPTRSCGFHFFYPASMMRLIEVIEGEETSEETLQAAANFAQAIRKTADPLRRGARASWSTASSTRRSPRSGG